MRTNEKEATEAIKPNSAVQPQPADLGLQFEDQAVSACAASSPWPFNLGDVTPLGWWRTMPADHLGNAQHLVLRETLAKVWIMQDRGSLLTARGDAAAAIALALKMMPVAEVTLKTDIAMTALTLCALDGSAAAALVLSHILRRAMLDHPFAKDLSISWLVPNLRRALLAKKHSVATGTKPKTSGHNPIHHRQS